MKPSAVTVDGDLLLERVAAGPFEEGRDAAAAQLAARASTRLAPRVEAVPVGERQALVEDLLELAAVVGLAPSGSCRASARAGSCCAGAARRGSMPRLARRRVHQPLDDVDRLGPAGAAVGAGRRRVGQHRREVQVDRSGCRRCWSRPTGRSAAGSRRRPASRRRRRWRATARAAPAPGRRASSASSALARDVAAVHRREELLDALGAPLDRALQRARRIGDDDVFRIGAGLHAEAAADVADEHAHLLLRRGRQRVGRSRRARRSASGCSRAASIRPLAGVELGERRERGSIGDGARRWLTRSSATTCAARANAAAVASGVAVAHLGGDVVGRVGADSAARRPRSRRAASTTAGSSS